MSAQSIQYLMHEPIRKLLTDLLAESLLQIGVEALPADIYNALVEPPNTDLGHLAFGCFISAKQLKKSPALVATELKAALHSKTQSWQGLSSVEAAGPYLNFKFDSALLFDKVVRSLLSGQTLREPLTLRQ
jgi:arginyl-tRNA synthetase